MVASISLNLGCCCYFFINNFRWGIGTYKVPVTKHVVNPPCSIATWFVRKEEHGLYRTSYFTFCTLRKPAQLRRKNLRFLVFIPNKVERNCKILTCCWPELGCLDPWCRECCNLPRIGLGPFISYNNWRRMRSTLKTEKRFMSDLEKHQYQVNRNYVHRKLFPTYFKHNHFPK